MSNTSDKLSILEPFLEEVNSYLPEIEANLERLAASPGDLDALEETYRRSHTIGGSASMMDFSNLAHVAHGMEDILCDVLDGLTTLDEATLALLQRSLGRVRLLVEGIRTGADGTAIIAEDDNDYAQYRASMNAASQEQAHTVETVGASPEIPPTPVFAAPAATPMPASQSFDMSEMMTPLTPSMTSFDEVLASFRTPSLQPDEEIEWPETPAQPKPTGTANPASPVSPSFSVSSSPVLPPAARETPQAEIEMSASQDSMSALDALVASTRKSPTVNRPTQPQPTQAAQGSEYAAQYMPPQQSAQPQQPSRPAHIPVPPQVPAYALTPAVPATPILSHEETLPVAYSALQQDAQTLEQQVTSLRSVVAQLRSAMTVIEAQRAEFKGFLDGSKDALDRMEDWAGKAMKLNLRSSPEQVRRYLPLSVMWVSNTKLKKVLDLLAQITDGVEMTDEQLQNVIQQLQSSITACGDAFAQAQSEHGLSFAHEQGWTPWEMQVGQAAGPQGVQERVTFERRGDPDALRAELEAQLREEIRQEYEQRFPSPQTQAELEQRIRHEMLQEFEARQRSQKPPAPVVSETMQEIEARLRSAIEIQVRQEVLEQLGVHEGDISALVRSAQAFQPTQSAPVAAENFIDRARQSVGHPTQSVGTSPATTRQGATAHTPMPPAQQKSVVASVPPTQNTKPITPLIKSTGPVSQDTTVAVPGAFAADFGEEAIEIFRLEAEEHLQTISVHVAALEKDPTNKELIQGVRRATHTLKGAAGMMGFRAIADLCHISEDLLDSIMEGTTEITPPVLSIILDTSETLDVLITGKESSQVSEEAKVNALRVRYTALLGEQSQPFNENEDIDDVDDVDNVGDPVTDAKLVAGAMSRSVLASTSRSSGDELSVRVRLQKLDELVNLFGELLVNRSVLEERLQRLIRLVADVSISSNRLQDVGQKLESNFEAATLPSGHSVQVMPGEGRANSMNGHSKGKNGHNGVEPAHFADFDELELDRYTEFHRLARGLSEGISDMATLSTEMDAILRDCENVFSRENRLSTTFQDRLMKVRLVPLSSMTPRLYRSARAVALKQGKEIEFLMEGLETEVDRTVFEEISGPLQHLMRNAVNHAIEKPEVRIQSGKSPAGQVKLSAMYEGNHVVITVRDDGTGINAEQVRSTAIDRGLIRPDQVLTENELIDLIFRPGFSTASVLSEESGRGVGLDVVHDSVSRLRGTIEVESMPGQGTAFTMKFPTSLAIQSAMMVVIAGQQYAIPTSIVESVGRIDTHKSTTIAGQRAVVVQNEVYPLTQLAHYLSLPEGTIEGKSPILFVNVNGNRVALVVEDIRAKQDIVVKNLGPHLRQVRGIAGATVLGNGRVVLILELGELLSTRPKAAPLPQYRESAVTERIATMPMAQKVQASLKPTSAMTGVVSMEKGSSASRGPAASGPERGKHILIVDDSPSVRRVVGTMLKQNGKEVQMARDGVEALELIARELPAAVLLDIEMPRMDGYELIATLRSQEQYRTLPLVVLTSRAAAKHQQRAMQLGANAYVVKPYQDEELLNMLNSLIYGAVVR